MGRVCGRGWRVFWADRNSAAMRDQCLLDWQKGAAHRALPFHGGDYSERLYMQRPNLSLAPRQVTARSGMSTST